MNGVLLKYQLEYWIKKFLDVVLNLVSVLFS